MAIWHFDERGSNDGDSIGDPTPTTVTVFRILSASNPSRSTTSQSTSQTKTTTTFITSTFISSSSSRKSTPSSKPPASSASSTSSLSRTSVSSSPTSSDTSLLSQNNSRSSLGSGAIAGIVLVCIFAFAVGIFFAFRAWSKKKREKQNKIWSRSMIGKHYAIDNPETSYEEAKLASENGNLPISTQTLSNPQISKPPISYNNDAVFQYSTTPPTPTPTSTTKTKPSSSSSPSVFTSPVYSPGLMSLSPYSTNVICTFIPSLPDELSISIGETLRVLAGYEDGWSLCMNTRGKQGMVPNECLEKSFSSIFDSDDGVSTRKSSPRVSSLAQVVRHGR